MLLIAAAAAANSAAIKASLNLDLLDERIDMICLLGWARVRIKEIL